MLHKRHNRMFKSVATAATVAIAAAMIAVGAPAASAAPRVINVDAAMMGFSMKTINVKAGEQVSICVKSTDTDHDLTVTDLKFVVTAPKGPAVCKTLTAPSATGTHKYICSLPSHDITMNGKLVVGAAGASEPAAAAPGADAPADAPQVKVPAGGVQTGGGSTAGLSHVNLLMLGGGLLVAAMMSVLLGTRVTRRD